MRTKLGNFRVNLTVTLEGCGEKMYYQCLLKSGERVKVPDVDWQGTPQLGISLGKAAVSKAVWVLGTASCRPSDLDLSELGGARTCYGTMCPTRSVCPLPQMSDKREPDMSYKSQMSDQKATCPTNRLSEERSINFCHLILRGQTAFSKPMAAADEADWM